MNEMFVQSIKNTTGKNITALDIKGRAPFVGHFVPATTTTSQYHRNFVFVKVVYYSRVCLLTTFDYFSRDCSLSYHYVFYSREIASAADFYLFFE